ncbi:hypothetical protein SAMN02745127_02090 [Oceanospirillum multiglobuliferum]|uniref:Uncharacterized protein n=1 Tax=Oceanospirillum multiglobuliferum TaxID=64969 RepID=A0A1T4QYL5_9GAMM|nr:hypothetical protein [Oceanospirillum multiglobuliferum]OPX57050.1 hypothetical protein BTE48_01065 [Oceanospirillum multiglobuliferum]SKA08912.1 hypothetical protein SAMN02745127_02090 [Oceanospirillum multiglobuliferum]
MSITKSQWQEIEEELKTLRCKVVFDYQGQAISVERIRTGESRLDLAVYLDGNIVLGWGWPDGEVFDPQVKLLWRQRSKSIFKPAEKQKLIKEIGVRRAKKHFPKLDDKIEWYDPVFTSAAALVRQYKKLEGLSLKSCGYSAPVDTESAA